MAASETRFSRPATLVPDGGLDAPRIRRATQRALDGLGVHYDRSIGSNCTVRWMPPPVARPRRRAAPARPSRARRACRAGLGGA